MITFETHCRTFPPTPRRCKRKQNKDEEKKDDPTDVRFTTKAIVTRRDNIREKFVVCLLVLALVA